jgi:hypothetical protein
MVEPGVAGESIPGAALVLALGNETELLLVPGPCSIEVARGGRGVDREIGQHHVLFSLGG